MVDLARLSHLIEPEARALGYDLVRVKLTGPAGERTLQVMAEDPATGQLLVEQCMALSRRVSAAIDRAEEAGEELIHGAYNLEVSSPGIDRPLTRPKDFETWKGHEARVSLSEPLAGRKALHGELLGLENDSLVLDDRKSGVLSVPLEQVHSAKLVLTDKLIAATKPIDMSGAEEIEETTEEEKVED